MRSAFEPAGEIRGVDLLASLVSLWREKASGTLRFSRDGATAGFEILEGEIVSVLSSRAQFDVAAILSRAGKLDSAAVERLKRPEGGDAATAALQAGMISIREWKWGQKIRAIEILSDVLGWLEGDYEWDASKRPAAGDWALPIPRLLLELFLRSRDRTLVEHYLGPADLPLVRTERFDEEFESFGLTEDAGSVVRLIDEKATAEEIAERAPADEFAVLKLLAALTTLGLIHPVEAAAAGTARRKKRRRGPREARQTPPRAPSPPPPPVAEPEPALEPEPEAPPLEAESAAAEAFEPEAPEPEQAAGPAAPGGPPEGKIRAEREVPSGPLEALPVLPFEPASEPADLIPQAYESPMPLEERRMSIEEEGEPTIELSRSGGEPPALMPPGRGGGSGALLAGLLAVLVIAVALLLYLRSRPGAPGEPVPATPREAQEAPVFPPAETAVPLPRRGKGRPTASQTPAPAWTPTRPPAAWVPGGPRTTVFVPIRTPTVAPTRPAPTKSPTARPTSPAPTSTRTSTATRTATATRTLTATRTPTPTKAATLSPTRPSPTKTKSPMPAPTRPVPTKSPAPPRAAPTARPPTPVPTRPAPTKPAAPTSAAAPSAGEPGASRAEWLRRAESDRQALSRRRNARYAIQLELACEVETLQKAWAWDRPAGSMWLLTTSYRGRTCFRVLWGHYATLAQAEAARAQIPAFFVVPGNRPVPVPVR